jgi:hypothetical protein
LIEKEDEVPDRKIRQKKANGLSQALDAQADVLTGMQTVV